MAELSSLRDLEELRGYTQSNPLSVSQQEAIEELSNRQKAASAAGTVSPFESSFNPFNPNFRATAQNAISNMLGGSQISSKPNYLQGRIANSLSGLVDFAPVVGDAVGVGDTITSYRQGDMLGTGINALATGVGVLPLVGGPASRAVKAGGNRVRSALRGIDAWHGSPYKFENFSMDSIGTGEGAQAYGHGLYFAENKGVGEQYSRVIAEGQSGWDTSASPLRASLSDQARTKLTNLSDQVGESGVADIDAAWLSGGKERALARVEELKAERSSFGFPQSDIDALDEYVNTLDLDATNGSLYNVDLNVSPDELLDWDAPVNKKMQDLLDELAVSSGRGDKWLTPQESWADYTGAQAYDNLGDYFTSAEEASKFLNEKGIQGIRYLDGDSRSAGEGTRNFVIFDDSLIDTKRVNDKLTDSWMNSEARMARADEQGLTKTLYHGTHADIDEFDPNMVDIGTHLGTSEQANERLKDVYKSRNGLSTFAGGDAVDSGANIIPVRANLGNALEMNDVGMWSDSEKVISELQDMPEFHGKFDDAWEELGLKDSYEDSQDWIDSPENREMLDEINTEIRRQGYDSIRYANQVENKYGNLAGTRPEVAARKKILSDELEAIDLSASPSKRPAPSMEDVNLNPNAVNEWINEQAKIKAAYSPDQEQRIFKINQELKSLDEIGQDDIYSYIILDPKNIRSTNAEFDPTKADSSDLLSSISPTQSSLRNIV